MLENPNFQPMSGDHQAPELQEVETPKGELYLRFFVAEGSEFALPAIGIHRIIEQAPDFVTPVPNVSPLLLGTLNQQGRVIWVVDLSQFLGCGQSVNTDRAEIPVVAIEEQGTMLGLAVDQVVGTDWLDAEALETTASPSEEMAPFLKGEWPLKSNSESNSPLKLLDHVAILRSGRWVS